MNERQRKLMNECDELLAQPASRANNERFRELLTEICDLGVAGLSEDEIVTVCGMRYPRAEHERLKQMLNELDAKGTAP